MSNFAYTSPGVSVSEVLNPTVAPFIAGPSALAIVGAAQGFETATERITLNGVTPYTFVNQGLDESSLKVVDLATGSTIGAGNYYLVESSDPDLVDDSGDETFTIQRTSVPATAPSVAVGSSGVLTGSYVYAISFVNPLGETTIGPQSAQIALVSQAVNLSGIPVDTSVTNTATARNIYRAKVTGSVVGTFYLVATIANNSATTLANENLSDATAATHATPTIGIADGGQVIASYQFTDVAYFQPQNFTRFIDVVAAYGNPYDSNTGAITSQLSFAIMLALQNGATEIVGVAAKSSGDSDIENAILQLEGEDVSLVTAVSGSSSVHSALQSHVDSMNGFGLYRVGIIGSDGTTSSYSPKDLQDAAKAFNDESIIFVSPATFIMTNPVNSAKSYNVGGQYMAAAIGGMFSARDVQVPLTRKLVAGFSGIADSRTPTQQTQDSQAGLLEVVQVGGSNGPLQIRHGITTAASSINTAEASVVRSKHEMAKRLQSGLDGAIVGQIFQISEVSHIVESVTSGILEQLVVEQIIQGFTNVSASLLPNNPSVCQVTYSYLPTFSINNINVLFTIDTNTGDFNLGVTQ